METLQIHGLKDYASAYRDITHRNLELIDNLKATANTRRSLAQHHEALNGKTAEDEEVIAYLREQIQQYKRICLSLKQQLSTHTPCPPTRKSEGLSLNRNLLKTKPTSNKPKMFKSIIALGHSEPSLDDELDHSHAELRNSELEFKLQQATKSIEQLTLEHSNLQQRGRQLSVRSKRTQDRLSQALNLGEELCEAWVLPAL